MKSFLITVQLKSGNVLERKLETHSSLNEMKDNFDEELRKEVFSLISVNESISVPIENVDFYELKEYEELEKSEEVLSEFN